MCLRLGQSNLYLKTCLQAGMVHSVPKKEDDDRRTLHELQFEVNRGRERERERECAFLFVCPPFLPCHPLQNRRTSVLEGGSIF